MSNRHKLMVELDATIKEELISYEEGLRMDAEVVSRILNFCAMTQERLKSIENKQQNALDTLQDLLKWRGKLRLAQSGTCPLCHKDRSHKEAGVFGCAGIVGTRRSEPKEN